MNKRIILTGLQPSGNLTIGNYIGAISQLIEYEKKYKCFIFVADMHAITVPQNKDELKRNIKRNLALYLACGLSEDNIYFIQSENPYHANLSWVLECNTSFGELARMTQFKDKKQKSANFSCGLYTYPVLMASDILMYDADFVPVGADQKQHVELARNIAEHFNKKHGEVFKVPVPLIPMVGAKIKDLQHPDKKMSKSAENENGIIYLLDAPEIAEKKIKRAVTDSDNKIVFDEVKKPGVSNLLTIYSSLKNISIKEAVKQFEKANYGLLKTEVATCVKNFLIKIQTNYNKLINSDKLDKILDYGRDFTNRIAKEKCKKVFSAVGLGRNT